MQSGVHLWYPLCIIFRRLRFPLSPFPSAVSTRNQLLIPKTSFPMVVDNAAGLQVRIDRDRPHIFQPPLFQVGTDPVRQAVSGWNAAFLVAHIKVSLPLGKAPDVPAE